MEALEDAHRRAFFHREADACRDEIARLMRLHRKLCDEIAAMPGGS